MAIDEAVLGAELRGRHGVTTRARLRRLGMTDRMIDGLATRCRLRRLGRGVFVDPGSPDSFLQRVAIAWAMTGGVACFPTAGTVWEFRKTPRPPDVHVAVPWTRKVTSYLGVVVHRTCELRDCDIVRRRDGIVVTSPPRTVFDAAAWLDRHDLESMIEQGIHRSNFIVPTLWMQHQRLSANGRRGSGEFASVLAERPAWRKPAESDHELRLERAMRTRGFPPLTRGHAIEVAPGKFVHPDLAWHGGRMETAYDRWRDMKVRRVGNHVERVTDVALDECLDETIEDLWALWQSHRGKSTTEPVDDLPQKVGRAQA